MLHLPNSERRQVSNKIYVAVEITSSGYIKIEEPFGKLPTRYVVFLYKQKYL